VDIYDDGYSLLASSEPATRVNDTTFTTATAYPSARWIQIHGSPAYYFADNYPKGDFVTLQFTHDLRTNGEAARLAGVVDCDGDPVARPSENYGFESFDQTQHCLPWLQCAPMVVCFSPNEERWKNGITIPFPADFIMDEVYGSKWQGVVQPVMTDLFFHPPHKPLGVITDSETADSLIWTMDDGTCQADSEETTEGGATIFRKFYPLAPQVEARISLPGNYGLTQSESPAALPAGIEIGWLSPVDNAPGAGVAAPPAAVGFKISGLPASTDSAGQLHARLCAASADESVCRFKAEYADMTIGCA
jgi:hypothetical protein